MTNMRGAIDTLNAISDKSGGGCSFAVIKNGELVLHETRGSSEFADGSYKPWSHDTLSVSFSTTKGVASTLLHIAVADGKLNYSTRVAEIWPEFAKGGKQNITVANVLCHQAGLHNIRSLVETPEQMCDWEYMTQQLADRLAPMAPYSASAYHAVTYGWLTGEIVRRAYKTKKSFSQLVIELGKRLDDDGLFVGVPESQSDRVAQLQMLSNKKQRQAHQHEPHKHAQRSRGSSRSPLKTVRRKGMEYLFSERSRLGLHHLRDAMFVQGIRATDFSRAPYVHAAIPGAGGAFTALGLAKMYAAIGGFGLDGASFFEPEQLREISKIRVREADKTLKFKMGWRYGYHGLFSRKDMNMRNAFGHLGLGGSGAWVDPSRKLAVAYTTSTLEPLIMGLRIGKFNKAVIHATDR